MRKHWKVFMALLLALMLLTSSVCMAEGGVEVLPETEATATPEVTVEPAETPVPEATEAPADLPEAEATEEAPAEAPDEGSEGETNEGELDTSIEIDQDAAASADVPEATVAPPVRPQGRETWVVMNIGMKNLADARAKASNMMAKFLLARAVADNAPVGVFMMRESAEVFRGAVTTPAEWDALMNTLAGIGFDGSGHNVEQFESFAKGLRNALPDLADVDLRILAADCVTTINFNIKSHIKYILKRPGVSMYFYRFQKTGQELDSKMVWLDDRIRLVGEIPEFTTEEFNYEEKVRNPIATAMEVFGLNLLAPQTTIVRDGNAVTWAHKGMDTLLVLGTDKKGVTVTAGEDVQGMGAFPVVIPMDDTQCMVLLRNAAPGTYRIEGTVNSLTAAYLMDAESVKPVVQDLQADSEPWTWYLEDRVLRVSMNLPQVRDIDLGKVMYIGQEEEPAAEQPWAPADDYVQPVEDEPSVPADGETTASADGEETEALTGHLRKVILADEDVTHISSDENGHVWEIRVLRLELGECEICFAFNVGDFTVTSDVYGFEVVDRPLKLVAGGVAPLTCYYNVPGQEDAPVSANLASYFDNPDQQKLTYTPQSQEYTVEDDVFQYHRGDNVEEKVWYLQVSDGESAPVDFTVTMAVVDFVEAVARWQAQIAQVEYEGVLGEDTVITFTLPKECAALYKAVRAQYPALPENLTDALRMDAVLTDSRYPEGEKLPVAFTEDEDGTLTGEVIVPRYYAQETGAAVSFEAEILEESIPGQTIVPACTITVPNDRPALADDALKELVLKAGIHGAPDAREPLTFAAVNEAQKEGAVLLPDPFVPAQLFVDQLHLEGLTVTIEVDRPELVELIPVDETVNEADLRKGAGIWELNHEYSDKLYVLQIKDEGTVTVSISAHDGEHAGAETITWTFKVHSVYDIILLLIIISASVLAVLIIVLLVLRQIRKPSFARSNSVMNMRMCTLYSPNGPFARAPMSVYGKKETDLAKLFIACQQTPVVSLPMDVLADVAIQPGKRRSYRIVLGKRAEHLNIVVADVAQNSNKPVSFAQEQTVNIYADMNEVLFFQITSGR